MQFASRKFSPGTVQVLSSRRIHLFKKEIKVSLSKEPFTFHKNYQKKALQAMSQQGKN